MNTEFNTVNIETPKVNELLPIQLRGSAETFAEFLGQYYDFLNLPNGPSYIIQRIIDEHNIDEVVDSKFLDKISYEIANGIPQSPVVQKAFLLKRIIDYYNIRGSIESVRYFFRVFFNEEIEIYQPWEQVLIPSEGKWTTDTKAKIILFEGSAATINRKRIVQRTESGTIFAQAQVENSIEKNEGGKQFFELTFRSGSIIGEFDSQAPIETEDKTARGVFLRSLNQIAIENRGNNYDIGDLIFLDSMENITFSALVEKIGLNGEIQQISIDSYGISSEIHYRSNLTQLDFENDREIDVYINGVITFDPAENHFLINDIVLQSSTFNINNYVTLRVDVEGKYFNGVLDVENLVVDNERLILHDFVYYDQSTNLSLDFSDAFKSLNNVTSKSQNGSGAEFSFKFGSVYQTNGYYENQKGFLSDFSVLQDSFFFQTFSYEVNSTISSNEWERSFENIVHPAGLKVFNKIDSVGVATGSFNLNADMQLQVYEPPLVKGEETLSLSSSISFNTQTYTIDSYFEEDYTSVPTFTFFITFGLDTLNFGNDKLVFVAGSRSQANETIQSFNSSDYSLSNFDLINN